MKRRILPLMKHGACLRVIRSIRERPRAIMGASVPLCGAPRRRTSGYATYQPIAAVELIGLLVIVAIICSFVSDLVTGASHNHQINTGSKSSKQVTNDSTANQNSQHNKCTICLKEFHPQYPYQSFCSKNCEDAYSLLKEQRHGSGSSYRAKESGSSKAGSQRAKEATVTMECDTCGSRTVRMASAGLALNPCKCGGTRLTEDELRRVRREQERRQRREEEQQRKAEPSPPMTEPHAIRYGRVLGLHGKVTVSDIKNAYRKNISQYHPDKVSHLGPEFRTIAEDKTKDIVEAYSWFRKQYNF